MVKQVISALGNKSYKAVGIYMVANFFSKAVSFLLLPVFTNPKFLTPEDNGILSLFASSMMMLSPIIGLGMIQSANTDFYKKTKDDFAAAFTGTFFISLALASFMSLVLFVFKDFLFEKFSFPHSFAFILPFIAFLIFATEQLLVIIRNRNEANNYAIASIIKTVIEYGVSIILIVYFFKGWQGRVWGIGCSLIAINLIAIAYYAKNNYIKVKFSKQHLVDELKFGLPIFVFQLCVFMLGTTNKIFLAIFNVDKHELGIYAIATILGALVGTISQSILLYSQPQLYSVISKKQASAAFIKNSFLKYLIMLTALSAACAGVVMILYHYFIDPVYLPGIKYYFIIFASCFIWAINSYFFLFLLYFKEKKRIFKLALISLICSTIVNIIMVKNFMIMGDALAGIINTLIFSLLLYIYSNKIIRSVVQESSSTNQPIASA